MSIIKCCAGVYWVMGYFFFMTFCAKGNDLFSSEWLRNYDHSFNPSSVHVVIHKDQQSLDIKNDQGTILVQVALPRGNKLQDIIVNQKKTKVLLILSARETLSGVEDSINFVEKNGLAISLSTEIGSDGNRVFISELGSISESGRYLLAQCGIYHKRENGFVVLYQWKV